MLPSLLPHMNSPDELEKLKGMIVRSSVPLRVALLAHSVPATAPHEYLSPAECECGPLNFLSTSCVEVFQKGSMTTGEVLHR